MRGHNDDRHAVLHMMALLDFRVKARDEKSEALYISKQLKVSNCGDRHHLKRKLYPEIPSPSEFPASTPVHIRDCDSNFYIRMGW